MTLGTRELRDLAGRLLAAEAGGRDSPEALAEAMETACMKLHGKLSVLLGGAGFQALVGRALTLAQAGSPFLQSVEHRPEEKICLKGLREAAMGREPAEARMAFVALLFNVLWLLATFIGEKLALQQVSRAWPGVPLGDGTPGAKEEGQ